MRLAPLTCFRAVKYPSTASTAPILPFLVPSFQHSSTTRSFTASTRCSSQIGRAPLAIPPEVTLRIIEPPEPKKHARVMRDRPFSTIEVHGPRGILKLQVPPFISIEHDATGSKAHVKVDDAEVRHQREMWGTTRAYLQNHLLGVSEGHATILRLVGVGYRATVESTAATVTAKYPGQKFVSLKVGYSHPIELGIPEGVTASTPQPTRILLEGIEKEVINQFAAEIRRWRKPEPYKGKGVFVNDETIKLKGKKIK
ncbi:MAG: hypothetical protein M1825_000003 [Sarcosagium campestre]|nr:MAG: hypothetical protein M1825_000003 [Sarcosagium campestre]